MIASHHFFLLLQCLDDVPIPPQILLPQCDLVVAAAHGEDVATQGPTHAPDGGVEVEDLGVPLAGAGGVRGPDTHRLVLGGTRDVALLQHGGAPGDIAHPVRVAGQGLPLQLVAASGGIVDPDLDEVVAASSDETPVTGGTWAGGAGNDGAGNCGRSPGNGVDAEAVGGECGVVEVVVLKLDDGDAAVGGGAGQEAAGLVGRPGDDVDGGLVQGEFEDALPRALLLAPDEYLAIVA